MRHRETDRQPHSAGEMPGEPGGYEGQEVKLIFMNGNTTLKHGIGNLRLNGGCHGVANQVVTLVFDGAYWYGG